MDKIKAMQYFRVNQDLADAAGVSLQAVRQWDRDTSIPEASLSRVEKHIKKHRLKPVYASKYQELKSAFRNMSATEQAIHGHDVPGGKIESNARTQDD